MSRSHDMHPLKVIDCRCKIDRFTEDPEMKFGTWEAIARRQAWYVIVLEQRLGEARKERVDAGTDLETMRYVLALAKRVDRHEQLMIRHLSKGVASAPEKGKRHR